MVGGVWLDKTDLQAMLDKIAAGYAAEATIKLEPYANADMGFSGVAPAGWVELDAGVLTRSDPATDPTFFIQLSAPLESSDELTERILGNFGASDLGDPVEAMAVGDLTWEVFMPDGELGIVIARATGDTAVHMLGVAASPDEIEALTASVLQPAVGAFTPDS